MSYTSKRAHEEDHNDYPRKKRIPSAFLHEDRTSGSDSGENNVAVDSPGPSISNVPSYGQHFFETRTRYASNDSLSDDSGCYHKRSTSINKGSPPPSPNSVYNAASFDNMTISTGMTESPKPMYSHSSSSHKFQDYNKSDDEDDSHIHNYSFSKSNDHNTSSNHNFSSPGEYVPEGRTRGFFTEDDNRITASASSAPPSPDKETVDRPKYSSIAQKMMVSILMLLSR